MAIPGSCFMISSASYHEAASRTEKPSRLRTARMARRTLDSSSTVMLIGGLYVTKSPAVISVYLFRGEMNTVQCRV